MAKQAKPEASRPPVIVNGSEVHLHESDLQHGQCIISTAADLISNGHPELAQPLLDEFDSHPEFATNTVTRMMRIGVQRVQPKPARWTFVAAEEDVDILQALAESPHAMALVDLAAQSGHERKKCGERVAKLKEFDLIAPPPGKTNCVGITDFGRAWLARNSNPKQAQK